MHVDVENFARGVVTSSGALTGVSDDGKKTKIDPISAITLIMPVIQQIVTWVKQCKGLKNHEVQCFVADRHANTRTCGVQENQVVTRLMGYCKKAKREEIKNAKKLGVPADIGRYEIDEMTAKRVAHNIIGNFVNIDDPVEATELVAEASTGG